MKTRHAIVIGIGLAAGGLGIAAVAQEAGGETAGGPGGPFGGQFDFKALDTDGDGAVSRDEFDAGRAKLAEGLDADGNGRISKAEMVAFSVARATERATQMAEERFADQDLNGDGELDVAELAVPAGPGRLFDMADADGDGKVTAEEQDAMRDRMQERMGEGRGHGRHGMPRWMQRMGGHGGMAD